MIGSDKKLIDFVMQDGNSLVLEWDKSTTFAELYNKIQSNRATKTSYNKNERYFVTIENERCEITKNNINFMNFMEMFAKAFTTDLKTISKVDLTIERAEGKQISIRFYDNTITLKYNEKTTWYEVYDKIKQHRKRSDLYHKTSLYEEGEQYELKLGESYYKLIPSNEFIEPVLDKYQSLASIPAIIRKD